MCNKKDSNNLELCARLSIVSEPRFGSGNSTGIATAQAFKLKPPRHMFSSVPYEDNMVVNIHLTRRHAIMPAWPWRVYCCDYYLVYSSVQVILFPIHEELVHRAQVGGSCSVRRKTIRDAQRQKKIPDDIIPNRIDTQSYYSVAPVTSQVIIIIFIMEKTEAGLRGL